MPSLTAWLIRCGGVAHTGTARAAGYSPHAIARAVASGDVSRVRRSWLVGRDAPRARIAAATVGGRVTCLTAARAMGLWTPDHEDIHVQVARTDSRLPRSGLRLHTAQAPIRLARTVVDEPVINVLFHVARCAAPADALTVWESALRKRMTDAATLARVQWRNSRASALADIASELSDAGTETRFVTLLRAAGVAVRQQVRIDGHPIDGLIGERLAVQIDGFEHHSSPADRRRDLRQDARMLLRGFTVLRFDYFQVFFEPGYVVDTVLTALAQGAHKAV